MLLFIMGEAAAAVKGGEPRHFPGFSFANSLPKDDQSYLGVSGRKNFSLKNIRGSVIIVEMFNTYCTICPRNVPILNDIYSLIENNPEVRGKIKVISIAIGNTSAEIASYRKAQAVRYPILADPDFALHRLLGDPRVPYTVIVRKGMIVHTHQGVMDTAEGMLGLARQYIKRD
ncbi:MAG TPA: TlpA disulfide reductase family protein [Thermodesulfovibrionales bacterium]|nr:TlpA disulfide reductase family protein [Thermodesulfovibrionales bacterium]